MGNKHSVKGKTPIKSVTMRSGEEPRGKMLYGAKEVLLLHVSSSTQLRVVRNFRDALSSKAKGKITVTDFINIADKNEVPRGRAWLEQLNSVVLLCLTLESIDQFRRIVLEKGFADENGNLHPKVFSISFGEKLSDWPPKGLKAGSRVARDFHFGFTDLDQLRPQDFERSLRMDSLIASIRLTD